MRQQQRHLESKIYFPVIIGFPLAIWAIALFFYSGPLILSFEEVPVQRVLGEVTASLVLTLLGFNLLMTTRARWIEKIVGGLDKMYLIHRQSALLALVLLFLHVVVSPRYPEINPGKPLGVLTLLLIFTGIAVSAIPFLKRHLPYHKWLTIHRFMGAFFLLGVFHALLVPTLFSKLPLVRSYILGIAFLGIGSWVYRALLYRWIRPYRSYRVTDVKRLGNAVLALEMAPTGAPLLSLPGQFAFFKFPGIDPGESHPFTIASAPDQNRLRIAIKNLGDFTRSLQKQIKVGCTVKVEGPFGVFTQNRSSAKHQIWIAGGIGVTPFLAMANNIDNSELNVTLYWSVCRKEDAFFDNELQDLAEHNAGLSYKLWVPDENGPLTAEKMPETRNPEKIDVFICGPETLRRSMKAQLLAAGIPKRNIHSEEFSFR
ncbi:ferredoxin reductase family protein [Prosthecochloris sp.]|uniref:ferredoxin reductase family protein n=1 Tax=Prosthecochloris sp. TaxID=290513 RepID=UPI00257CE478|nr:ferredoxin reductase family protein [Prosthecochloris sp.]